MTRLRIACAGLGRMGQRHAIHFAEQTPRAQLVAVSSPVEAEREWARTRLGPLGVTVYSDYDDMLKHADLQAVVIASATTVHAEQAIKAIERDLHVLCEKPLSTSVEVSQSVLNAANRKPHLKVLCGFSRRFDASYRDAYAKAQTGLIGRPSVLRSQTCDKHDPSGFFVAYAQLSGGIFVDCSIHDIDLALWFYGGDATPTTATATTTPKVKSVAAMGITAVEPGLREHNDRDNAVGLVEFHDGRLAYFYASRMMAAGQEDSTEIIGTKGKLAVNTQPAMNLVNIYEANGVWRELPQHYFDRFRDAFVTEAREFTACCLDDTPVPMKLEGAVEAVRIGCALQEALVGGKKIFFDKQGNRVERAVL